MELLPVRSNHSNSILRIAEPGVETEILSISTDKPFIQANTEDCSLTDIKNNHIIPVFLKDNEPLISHADFIEAAVRAVSDVYSNEIILNPSIRVSHPIKGRIPEAKSKPANELLEHEKTLYYERMAFIIELPSISDCISGNTLSLTIGGVKSYSSDNLHSKKGSDEHFKVFIGFKNQVCTNLCVWTDGLMNDIRVSNETQLIACIRSLIENYNAVYHLNNLRKLQDYSLTEYEFAQIIGKIRMYPYLNKEKQATISHLLLGDSQITTVVKDYYRDRSFCRNEDGSISLWRMYNLLTGSNKSSYIDTFIDRSVNAYQFTEQLRLSIQNKTANWYLTE